MFNIDFSIFNPFDKTRKCLGSWHKPITKNKSLEWQIDRDPVILNVGLSITSRQSHAGVTVSLGLFGFQFIGEFCDNRHWDYEKDTWEIYEKEDN